MDTVSYLKNIPSPCYVLDEQRLLANLRLLKSIQERADIHILMALKGFAWWPMFPLIKPYIAGSAASSLWENQLCVDYFGWKPHTYAPVYREDEFPILARNSSHVVFNSWSQYQTFRATLVGSDSPGPEIGLRVNPGYSDVATDLYNPTAAGSRLGIHPDQMPQALPADISGLHYHVLCESRAAASCASLDAFEKRFSSYFPKLSWVNFGGGHLMTASDYDLDKWIGRLKQFRQKFPWLKVYLEPSAAFVWQTGELICTVLDIVENQGVQTAMLDVSFTAHMPDTLEMPYQPQIVDAQAGIQEGQHVYRMGGISCLSGDFLPEYSFPRPPFHWRPAYPVGI